MRNSSCHGGQKQTMLRQLDLQLIQFYGSINSRSATYTVAYSQLRSHIPENVISSIQDISDLADHFKPTYIVKGLTIRKGRTSQVV
jgi:hypothetical protein